ncbi:MAG TPA: CHAT domain-containing tetratricopeptide repeat protein [Pyrinomonadaceae bacterium]|nr:CHAT domain-containing tetratricopeptide repeat protein [Pyrinomonadaceae bacterium]
MDCLQAESDLLQSKRLSILLIILIISHPALAQNPLTAFIQSAQQSSDEQSRREIITLESGKPIGREISGGQKQIYRLALTEGQYALVTVEQRGIDLTAHLFAADGQLVADIDSQRSPQGTEKIEVVAEAAGTFRIEVEPSLPKALAGAYAIQLDELRAATADEKLLYRARQQFYESLRLNVAGKTDEALELARSALDTREKILGENHADVAASLRALGMLYVSKNDPAQAEAILQRAMETTAKISGTESLEYADVLHWLARVQSGKGDRAQAEQLNRRALAIREKAAGPESMPVANSLINLAALYRARNDLPGAEQSYLRALAIREKLLGADHADVGAVLNNLGLLYYGAGDYDSAEPILERALAVEEKALGPNHRYVADDLNNLGLVEWKRGNYEKAKSYYLRALSIFEKTSGLESQRVAGTLTNLGIIYKEADRDYVKAEESYQKALAIMLKVAGEDSVTTANIITSLAIIYRLKGDYDRAEKFGLRAIAIYEKVLGPNNQNTLMALFSLARIYAAKGDVNRAIEYQQRISAVEEKIIPLNLALGSERQKIAYLPQLQYPDKIITLHVGLARDNAEARDLAVSTVLRHKGLVLDALSESLSALRQRFSPQDQALLDELSDINSKLSRLALSGPQKISPTEQQSQLKELDTQRERIEAEISRRSAGFYESSQPVTLAAVQAAVPKGAALVEFAIYHPFDWKAANDDSAFGEPRYVVYVIRNQGEVRWAELGAAKDVDASVDALRQALTDPRRGDVRQLARAVDEQVMRPLRLLLGDATQILISPDGELNLLPFQALVDEQGRYLIERYAFTYLTSGRDLLRMQVARESKSVPLVVANPTFGETASVQKVNAPTKWAGSNASRRGPAAARSLSELYFAPLDGTAQEAEAIQKLFPEANLLTGARATKAALKQAVAPRILHIATHGFFLQAPQSAPDARAQLATAKTRGADVEAESDNPLLRSGLALAGANRRGAATGDDGILTALEASGLNLWGTKLVVLSACDTGLGEVRDGEGVYGLRRAFVLAGAESLLMSLWPASDYSTRTLMTDYYRNLKRGLGRGEALRQVQLDMLRRNPKLHPFYWANFIHSGEWADLEGRR